MPIEARREFGLTGNQLKLIAMLSMTLDHIGLVFFPGVMIFRHLGRLALPIYAYMIAEGCRHTRSRRKYLLRLFGMGAACQAVYFFVMGSLYQCILITFSLSVMVIFLLEKGRKWLGLGLAAVYLLCRVLPDVLAGTDFAIDYGIWGVLLPVLVYLGRDRRASLWLLALGLLALALDYGGNQWYALGAVPVLALYSGQRGKYAIGKLFYLYYPLHLAVIQCLRWII